MADTADKKVLGWLTLERLFTLFMMFMGVGGFVVTVNNLGARVTRLEQRDEERQRSIQDVKETVIELRAELKAVRDTVEDTKSLLERIDAGGRRGTGTP